MVIAILLTGVFAGVTLAVATWIVSTSVLLTMIAYPLGGLIGCFLAGAAIYFCQSRPNPGSAESSCELLLSGIDAFARRRPEAMLGALRILSREQQVMGLHDAIDPLVV
jgi:ABC-type Fe3+-siderophore transport system permease subunit